MSMRNRKKKSKKNDGAKQVKMWPQPLLRSHAQEHEQPLCHVKRRKRKAEEEKPARAQARAAWWCAGVGCVQLEFLKHGVRSNEAQRPQLRKRGLGVFFFCRLFAGGANLVGGIPRLEFGSTLASLGLDHVLVLDWKQTWYVHTQSSIRAKLVPVVKHYDKVCFVGNCLGATGALLMADLADVVVAFSPLTSLNRARGMYGLNSRLRIEKEIRDSFEEKLEEAVVKCRECVHVYYTPEKDSYFAPWAPSGAKVVMSDVGNPRVLRDKGLLVPFLQKHFNHDGKPCSFVWSQ